MQRVHPDQVLVEDPRRHYPDEHTIDPPQFDPAGLDPGEIGTNPADHTRERNRVELDIDLLRGPRQILDVPAEARDERDEVFHADGCSKNDRARTSSATLPK